MHAMRVEREHCTALLVASKRAGPASNQFVECREGEIKTGDMILVYLSGLLHNKN